MSNNLAFNRVTFGLPVESFRVEAYISLEERLPVVTEYVLRLIRICNAVSLAALREYFGFSDSEMLAVTESLLRQGLLIVEDDQAKLSRFAREKFDAVGDEHPRFSKVELRSDTVHFDLISFTPLTMSWSARCLPTDNIIKLKAPEEALGRSIARARDAYSQRYSEIASMRGDLREKSFGVYAVVDVESKGRTYAPTISVSFGIDQDGQVQRSFDASFERIVPDDLFYNVNEQVTAAISQTLALADTELQDFVDIFEDTILNRYITGKKFDLLGYLDDVHESKSKKYPEGMEPVFGNLYLQSNRERILARLRDSRSDKRKQGKLLTSNVAWLAPNYSLWGRGRDFEEIVRQLRTELRQTQNDLYLGFYARPDEESTLRNTYRIQDSAVHCLPRVGPSDNPLTGGRLEILLYPTAFAFVLLHVPLPGNPRLWAPVGFATTLSKHLDFLNELFSIDFRQSLQVPAGL